jgi:hypothetical protein
MQEEEHTDEASSDAKCPQRTPKRHPTLEEEHQPQLTIDFHKPRALVTLWVEL